MIAISPKNSPGGSVARCCSRPRTRRVSCTRPPGSRTCACPVALAEQHVPGGVVSPNRSNMLSRHEVDPSTRRVAGATDGGSVASSRWSRQILDRSTSCHAGNSACARSAETRQRRRQHVARRPMHIGEQVWHRHARADQLVAAVVGWSDHHVVAHELIERLMQMRRAAATARREPMMHDRAGLRRASRSRAPCARRDRHRPATRRRAAATWPARATRG